MLTNLKFLIIAKQAKLEVVWHGTYSVCVNVRIIRLPVNQIVAKVCAAKRVSILQYYDLVGVLVVQISSRVSL